MRAGVTDGRYSCDLTLIVFGEPECTVGATCYQRPPPRVEPAERWDRVLRNCSPRSNSTDSGGEVLREPQRSIVAADRKLVCVNPDGWNPFKEAEILEIYDSDVLTIAEATAYSSKGEHIEFCFSEAGIARSIKYAGVSMQREPRV